MQETIDYDFQLLSLRITQTLIVNQADTRTVMLSEETGESKLARYHIFW